MPTNRRLSLPLLISVAAVLLGTGLRLHNIRDRSMEHVEMFVPNIPLRADLSIPKPRMDLWTVVTSTLNSDTHPPGYYIFMWFVTKCFGTSTLAIRLPSVLFAAACIGLVFWLGVLIGQPVAGCIASLFLALNGYLIVWNETGRMYTMACFLGLVTTILLLLLARSDKPRRAMEIGYAGLTLMGLATHVFFWPFLATQAAWVVSNAWVQRRPMPRLLSVQILVVILGSPLLAFAAYQSGNPVTTLSKDAPRVAKEYAEFLYLIPSWWDDTAGPVGKPADAPAPRIDRAAYIQSFFLPSLLLLPVSLLLLIVGIWRLKPAGEPLLGEPPGSFAAAWLAAAVLAVLTILTHIWVASHHLEAKPELKYTKAMTVLPLLIFLFALLLRKSWDRLRNWRPLLSLRFLQGGPPLVWLMAVGPFALLAAASFAFRPMLYPRGLLYLAPYLMLTLATGVVALGKRSRAIALALFLILGVFHGISVAAYRDRLAGPVDFKGFADKLAPHIHGDDMIFLHQGWHTTPILYYLKPANYHILASHYVEACARNPNARVWALVFDRQQLPPEMQPALQEYRAVETVDYYLVRAVLYCRGPCQLD